MLFDVVVLVLVLTIVLFLDVECRLELFDCRILHRSAICETLLCNRRRKACR
jgi:hypothetical protein